MWYQSYRQASDQTVKYLILLVPVEGIELLYVDA